MSSSFRQSGDNLDDLAALVDRIARDPAVPVAVASALAESGGALVRAGFTATRAPDGAPWAPLKRPRVGIGGPLLRTGDLRDEASTATSVSAGGVVFEARDPKSVHQRGYRPNNLPARPFYPGRLPTAWEVVMGAAADRALEEALDA